MIFGPGPVLGPSPPIPLIPGPYKHKGARTQEKQTSTLYSHIEFLKNKKRRQQIYRSFERHSNTVIMTIPVNEVLEGSFLE